MNRSFAKKTALILTLLSTSTFANANKQFYIGAEYGGLMPLSKKFKIDDVDVKASADRVDGLRLGYQFYDDMFIDLAYNRRHGIEMKASMDGKDPNIGAYNVSGSAKFRYESYILSIKYAMPNGSRFTPYLGAGVGVAKIGVNKQKPVRLKFTGFDDESGFVAKKSKTTPAIRLSGGVDTKVNDTFSIYLDGRVEVTKKVPVNFVVYTPGTNNNVVFAEKKVKTRMGVAEAVLGVKVSF